MSLEDRLGNSRIGKRLAILDGMKMSAYVVILACLILSRTHAVFAAGDQAKKSKGLSLCGSLFESINDSQDNSADVLAAQTMAIVDEIVKNYPTGDPDGVWYSRTGTCIGYSCQILDALSGRINDADMKKRGPHAYVFRYTPSGGRVIIDPTWKQFFNESHVKDFPDILVVSERELLGVLKQVYQRGGVAKAMFDSKERIYTLENVLIEIYDFKI